MMRIMHEENVCKNQPMTDNLNIKLMFLTFYFEKCSEIFPLHVALSMFLHAHTGNMTFSNEVEMFKKQRFLWQFAW